MNLLMTKSRRPALGLSLSVITTLLLCACAVGPTYAPPAATTVTAWQAALPHNGEPASLKAWWASWNDTTMQGFIDAAQADRKSVV